MSIERGNNKCNSQGAVLEVNFVKAQATIRECIHGAVSHNLDNAHVKPSSYIEMQEWICEGYTRNPILLNPIEFLRGGNVFMLEHATSGIVVTITKDIRLS